jgi:hypothetical protein
LRVWIRLDLVKKNVSVEDCFPACEDKRSDQLKVIILNRVRGKEGRKPSFLKLERRCSMIDWGRGRGGSRGERGRDWRPQGFLPRSVVSTFHSILLSSRIWF